MYAPIQSPQNNWGTYGEKDSFNIFEMYKRRRWTDVKAYGSGRSVTGRGA